MNYPILLPMTKLLNAGGVVRPDDQLVFKNPYDSPMVIKELNFLILGTSQDAKQTKVRLQINGQYIIDDFVPLPLLCPRLDYMENNQNVSVFSAKWKFAKPLWLDVRDDILVEFQLDANDGFQGTSGTETFSISVVGESVDYTPKERYLPFNVVWNVPLTTQIITGSSSLQSPDSALYNGKNSPVFVTRMLADFGRWFVGSGTNVNEDFFLLQTRISHSNGSYIVKDPIRLFELFSGWGRNLDTRFVLQPKEFITIDLDITAFSETVSNPLTTQYEGGFSLQGYSIEAL